MRKNTFHKQTSFTYHQVIASARSAVLKYRTTGCNLISTRMKRRWNLQCKSSMQKDQIARPESCFIGQNLFIIQFCLWIFFFCKSVRSESKVHCLWYFCVSRGYYFMPILICSATEYNMNTHFQRIAKVIAEIFRAKIKNYFTKSSLYSTLKRKIWHPIN